MLLSKLGSFYESLHLICHVDHVCRVQIPVYAACYIPYDHSCRLLLYFEPCQLRGTHAYAYLPALVDSDPKHAHSSSIQGKSKLVFLLFTRVLPKISNDRLELLYKIRTPKLREWGTNCLGQISYFLFYPSSGTAGSMPQLFPIRVRRHGPPRGFNMTTRSKGGLLQVLLQPPKRPGLYVR